LKIQKINTKQQNKKRVRQKKKDFKNIYGLIKEEKVEE
jgi:hypothetical protein